MRRVPFFCADGFVATALQVLWTLAGMHRGLVRRASPGPGTRRRSQDPAFIEKYNARSLNSSLGYLSPEQLEKQHAQPPVKDAA
jgi:hypothetical protein